MLQSFMSILGRIPSGTILPIHLLLHNRPLKAFFKNLLQIVPSVQKHLQPYKKEKKTSSEAKFHCLSFCSFKELVKVEGSFLKLQCFL
jgi:hypothetical protein